eukprot:1191162-Amphidinium_carterae.1
MEVEEHLLLLQHLLHWQTYLTLACQPLRLALSQTRQHQQQSETGRGASDSLFHAPLLLGL